MDFLSDDVPATGAGGATSGATACVFLAVHLLNPKGMTKIPSNVTAKTTERDIPPPIIQKRWSLRCRFFHKPAEVTLLQMDQQQRDGRRSDARHARRLTQGFGALLVQAL